MHPLQFVSEDPEKSISTFLLTAAAIGMLFKVCRFYVYEDCFDNMFP